MSYNLMRCLKKLKYIITIIHQFIIRSIKSNRTSIRPIRRNRYNIPRGQVIIRMEINVKKDEIEVKYEKIKRA